MKRIILLVIILAAALNAQKKDPDEILNRVKENFSRVEDYKVNVDIKVDFDFIKVPEMNATVYFKYPDKMHLESESFAMLPKSGMNFSPAALLSGDYTAFYEKEEEVNGSMTSIVKVIPLGGGGDIVLTTLWIDTKHDRIRKVESTTKMQGSFSIELDYASDKYPLPSLMIFSMNMDKMDLPKIMTGETETESKKEKKEKTSKGRVTVEYSDYKVNQGIPDEVFEETKKK
jgi:hypothetical protein